MGMYRHRMPDREIQMAKDWTQEKLIDTLEKECEQLRGWYIAKIDQNAELQTQIESCSAEIERFRGLLKDWVDCCFVNFVNDTIEIVDVGKVYVETRAALKGDE